MKTILKVWLYACLSVVSFFVLACVWLLLWWWPKPDYYLPPEQTVRQQFESHKADYIRFVTLLRKDPAAASVDTEGKVSRYGIRGQVVPEYRDLIRKIGAKFVMIREDGSMEFELWGDGGAIMSDSSWACVIFPKIIRWILIPGGRKK